MRYDPDKHHRRSIRLRGYDYRQAGAYFVTLCVQNRECLLGEIADEAMVLSRSGEIVSQAWAWLAEQYPYVALDEWVVMPNHLHGIMVILDSDGLPHVAVGAVREPPLQGDAPLPPSGDQVLRAIVGAHRDAPLPGPEDVPSSPPNDAPLPRPGDVCPPRPGDAPRRKPLGQLIGAFKTVSTKNINVLRGTPGAVVWQRNYYEHVIRNEDELNRARAYIANNPRQWALDRENPLCSGGVGEGGSREGGSRTAPTMRGGGNGPASRRATTAGDESGRQEA
jgi:REP element-mobilizing transposase RayT